MLQIQLLDSNAPIHSDLIFTLVDLLRPDWQQLTLDERQRQYDDYCQVNHVIRCTVDSVQETIIHADLPQIFPGG